MRPDEGLAQVLEHCPGVADYMKAPLCNAEKTVDPIEKTQNLRGQTGRVHALVVAIACDCHALVSRICQHCGKQWPAWRLRDPSEPVLRALPSTIILAVCGQAHHQRMENTEMPDRPAKRPLEAFKPVLCSLQVPRAGAVWKHVPEPIAQVRAPLRHLGRALPPERHFGNDFGQLDISCPWARQDPGGECTCTMTTRRAHSLTHTQTHTHTHTRA